MGPHMKTTVEIADPLLADIRALAEQRRTTVRALIEEGLRAVLRASQQRARFRLRDASVGGEGLQPAFRGADWERIREAAYEDREA